MKISTKGRYGLRILLDIAQNGGDEQRLIRDISQTQNISGKYVSRLIIDLRDGGFLVSTRGAKGGYKLNKSPEDITLLDIVETMEGKTSVVDCVLCPLSCKRSKNCAARGVWLKINEDIREVFKSVTLRNIMDGFKNPVSEKSLAQVAGISKKGRPCKI